MTACDILAITLRDPCGVDVDAELMNPCATKNMCKHGGTCHPTFVNETFAHYSCSCVGKYRGGHCEIGNTSTLIDINVCY